MRVIGKLLGGFLAIGLGIKFFDWLFTGMIKVIPAFLGFLGQTVLALVVVAAAAGLMWVIATLAITPTARYIGKLVVQKVIHLSAPPASKAEISRSEDPPAGSICPTTFTPDSQQEVRSTAANTNDTDEAAPASPGEPSLRQPRTTSPRRHRTAEGHPVRPLSASALSSKPRVTSKPAERTTPVHKTATVKPPPSCLGVDLTTRRDRSVKITVVVEGPGQLIGKTNEAIRFVRLGAVDTVVVGDHNDVECTTVYPIKEMRVDLKNFWRDLSRQAREAFALVVQSPHDIEAISRFQALLPAGSAHRFDTVAELPVAHQVDLNLGYCDLVVVGDDNNVPVESRQAIARASVPLADLLRSSEMLVRRLAKAVEEPSARAAFKQDLCEVANKQPSPEFLSSIPTRGPITSITDGSVTSRSTLAVIIDGRPTVTNDFEHLVRRAEAPRSGFDTLHKFVERCNPAPPDDDRSRRNDIDDPDTHPRGPGRGFGR